MRSASVKIASWRDQDLGGLAQRGLRVDRAVGLDVERELVVVGALADAGLLDRVGDAADRREDRVDRDDADRLVGRLVLLRRAVAAAAADRQVHLELGLLLERRDVHVGVEDLDARGQVDVLRRDLAGAGDDERGLDLGRVGVHPAHDALEVQDDVGDVLGDALDRRELVGDALDPHARHGRAGERGRAARGAASCRTCSRSRGRAARSRTSRGCSSTVSLVMRGIWKSSIEGPDLRRGPGAGGERRPSRGAACGREGARVESGLLGVQLDDELLLHRRRDLAALGLAQHLRGQRVVVGLQPGRAPAR